MHKGKLNALELATWWANKSNSIHPMEEDGQWGNPAYKVVHKNNFFL